MNEALREYIQRWRQTKVVELFGTIDFEPSFARASTADLELESTDYEEAAVAFSQCRERGIQGSNTDFLICAAALRRDHAIFTTDGDFRHFARVLKLQLHESRA